MKQIRLNDGTTYAAELFCIVDGVLSIRLHIPAPVANIAETYSRKTETIVLIDDDETEETVTGYTDLLLVARDRYTGKPFIQLQKEDKTDGAV